MAAEGVLHSMPLEERRLALEVLAGAWQRLVERGEQAAAPAPILATVRAVAADLPKWRQDVDADYAHHLGEAAVWYLDRATRRLGDPDRSGHTAAQRALNLTNFAVVADALAIERLFALASALNAEDA